MVKTPKRRKMHKWNQDMDFIAKRSHKPVPLLSVGNYSMGIKDSPKLVGLRD